MESLELMALTELDAVNTIIGTIGESPINTLEDMTDVDAINALRILRNISRQEQARGWSFNRVPCFTLHPEEDNKIRWNDNFLFLKSHLPCHKLIHSGEYVKDLMRDSFIFCQPINVEIVLYVPFEELPEQMRSYVLAKACFEFQASYFGDDTLVKVTQMKIQEAWQHLQEFEIDNNNYSMLDMTYVRKLMRR